MKPWQLRIFLTSTVITFISGSAFFIMKYLQEPLGEFSVLHHPYQQIMLKTHILSAAVMLFSLGILTSIHILPYINRAIKKGRRSGLSSFIFAIVMAISGYFIQCFSSDIILLSSQIIHIGSSGLFCVSFVIHQYFVTKNSKVGVFISSLTTLIAVALLIIK